MMTSDHVRLNEHQTAAGQLGSDQGVPAGVQTQLRTMGMRVRKVIAGGYQITKKPTMAIYSHKQEQEQAMQQQNQSSQTVHTFQSHNTQCIDSSAVGTKRQRNLDEFWGPKQ
ncbi:hypothetical protein BASA50_003140 [Batrachochytrium salamandrivorans]|uniref:Uncharacterized protein n=1 Tax=Batrachochytrium salamandrivorans TaxID=1357716 RepID=A0ABQ8FJB1_9FUNG|nr:hypothetical protein BASA60_011123 [Batrachochytrium salamandrivorans]KAH6564127.1 hypothetical protein BASA62_008062 [Batrachochytrium salamandrivorans]KAH6581113.1 hypothetical protein BASA61_009236 [Batrachochytrium salamandrivorans]KAH6599254.1 hypothetical protein BASA50_003140 [Batrachochytrium salamandrivorans]KAH9253087.1 hypothetical protein BASA81_008994 [Batrachochytrium salamandrivorans]